MSEDLLRHSARLNIMSEAAPILVALATEVEGDDYNYQANDAVATKLKTLLTDLYNKLKADNKNNDKAEAAAQSAFNTYASKLTKVIDTLAKNIQRTNDQITRMTNCIDTENKVIAASSAKFARNNALKLQASKMCSAFAAEFIEATKNRLNEMNTMREIIAIVAKRFKKMPADLVEYLESSKNGFKAYMNSTEFKKFLDYQRKVFLDNAKGAALQKNHVTNEDFHKAGKFVKKWAISLWNYKN